MNAKKKILTSFATVAVALGLSVTGAGAASAVGGCFYGITCDSPPPPSAAEERCHKQAMAAGFLAGAGTAVTTTPVDIPGIVTISSFTYVGTRFFCSVGWS
jgi:hypothetical protein